ncbi:glycosyltransferase [Salinimicrobium sp. TIG7-5_MAKvit]|uniref:glycosyltransferase family 4 protein n=1 Tax=Salinimicrobium sp. TIG7-5_MAKvit TaxID=3121289 RepID=UPI003C6E7EF1
MRFAIFSHVEHSEREGRYYAYAPYVREMNIWLKYVQKVEVVAPVRLPPKGEVARQHCYQHEYLTYTTIPSFHFLNLRGAVKAVIKIPYILYKILGAMKRADHLHLRCPGNIGLLACICQIFFPSKSKSTKYAGNWDPEAKQPLSYRFQKWLLSNTYLTRNMQVLVYGEWPGQSKNVVSFFTASFSENEKNEVPKKAFSEPFIFVFVGNLVEGKRPLEAIKLVERLNFKLREGTDQEIPASYILMKLELYGDGPEREKLKAYVRENNLEQLISIKGNRSLEELKEAYQKAHFVILPSKSEGWPKALAEGMFFGCIPVATPVSCVPWMLDYGKRGILLEEFSQRLTANSQRLKRSGQRTEDRGQDGGKIIKLLADREKMKKMSEAASEWSQQYTLEKFEAAIRKILNNKP